MISTSLNGVQLGSQLVYHAKREVILTSLFAYFPSRKRACGHVKDKNHSQNWCPRFVLEEPWRNASNSRRVYQKIPNWTRKIRSVGSFFIAITQFEEKKLLVQHGKRACRWNNFFRKNKNKNPNDFHRRGFSCRWSVGQFLFYHCIIEFLWSAGQRVVLEFSAKQKRRASWYHLLSGCFSVWTVQQGYVLSEGIVSLPVLRGAFSLIQTKSFIS